jgi:hypothetical protein
MSDDDTTYGIYTNVDTLMASKYAEARINNDIFNNRTIMNRIYSEHGDKSFVFLEDKQYKNWNDYINMSDKACTKDSNCNTDFGETCMQDVNKCGFSTVDVKPGKFHINNKNLCLKKSKMPIKCAGSDCVSVTGAVYTEWRDLKDLDSDAKDRLPDEMPGLCIRGNWSLREYAENPIYRGSMTGINKDTSSFDEHLNYDPTNGKVYLTKEFCNKYDTKFASGNCTIQSGIDIEGKPRYKKDETKCPKNSKCITCTDGLYACSERLCTTGNKTNCMDDERCSTEFCTGNDCPATGVCTNEFSNCYTTTDVGEFLFGKTLFRMFDTGKFYCPKDTKKDVKENFEQNNFQNRIKNILSTFDKFPEIVIKIADTSLMNTKSLASKDFAGKGINLYVINWKKNEGIESYNDVGFIADEIQYVYPHIIKIKDGKKYIYISKKDIKDNNLKRIFLSANSGNWLLSNILYFNK